MIESSWKQKLMLPMASSSSEWVGSSKLLPLHMPCKIILHQLSCLVDHAVQPSWGVAMTLWFATHPESRANETERGVVVDISLVWCFRLTIGKSELTSTLGTRAEEERKFIYIYIYISHQNLY